MEFIHPSVLGVCREETNPFWCVQLLTILKGIGPSSENAALNDELTLEAKGGAKASAPEWESGGQRGRKKYGALFGGRGEESFICGSLPGSSCERRERRETERRETERRERERERRER